MSSELWTFFNFRHFLERHRIKIVCRGDDCLKKHPEIEDKKRFHPCRLPNLFPAKTYELCYASGVCEKYNLTKREWNLFYLDEVKFSDRSFFQLLAEVRL